jgi:hypothetical protein
MGVFHYPYDMIFQVVHGMAGSKIILHASSILKSLPKGDGFFHYPNRTLKALKVNLTLLTHIINQAKIQLFIAFSHFFCRVFFFY